VEYHYIYAVFPLCLLTPVSEEGISRSKERRETRSPSFFISA
jgi:hypothetical protein